MSKTKSAWQGGSTAFVKIYGSLMLTMDPLHAFVLALVAMGAIRVLS